MVSNELLEELKKIIKEDYRVVLTDIEVAEVATTLINFFDSLIQVQNENKYVKQSTN
jgi:hypothetical protein